MIDLQQLSSLPIQFDEYDDTLIFGEDISVQDSKRVPLKSLLPGLLNKTLVYPIEVYEEHRNIRYRKEERIVGQELTYDLMYLPEGLLGVEYIKSHIYFSPQNRSCATTSTVIEVLYGELTILLQKNTTKGKYDFETKIEDVFYVNATKGEKVALPTGFYYTFINSSEKSVIFSRVYRKESLADYLAIQREQGLSYFCIRKNARCEFVQNPRYKDTKELREIKPANTLQNTQLNFDKPLYSHVRKESSSFIDMLWC